MAYLGATEPQRNTTRVPRWRNSGEITIENYLFYVFDFVKLEQEGKSYKN